MIYIIVEKLGQPLSEVPYWLALPKEVFNVFIENKRLAYEKLEAQRSEMRNRHKTDTSSYHVSKNDVDVWEAENFPRTGGNR